MNSYTSNSDDDPAQESSTPRRRFARFFLVIVAAGILAFAGKETGAGIFACTGAGYAGGGVLTGCNRWYFVEPYIIGSYPRLRQVIDAAEILFLGNSHTGYAFSNGATRKWFADRKIPYHLMFIPSQGDEAARMALERFRPRPRLVVINADPFFDVPASPWMNSDSAWVPLQFHTMQWWQSIHRAVCGRLIWLCPGRKAVFRDTTTGGWILTWASLPLTKHFPVQENPGRLLDSFPRQLAAATAFADALPVPRGCIVLTSVPGNLATPELARRLAEKLGTVYIRPHLDDLGTTDGEHIDLDSGERWARAFLDELAPVVERCSPGGTVGRDPLAKAMGTKATGMSPPR